MKPSHASGFLPIRAAEIVRWVIEEDTSDLVRLGTTSEGLGPRRASHPNGWPARGGLSGRGEGRPQFAGITEKSDHANEG